MGTSPHHHPKQQQQKFPIQKVITRTLYCLLPLAILHLCFFPLLPFNRNTLPSSTQQAKSTFQEEEAREVVIPQFNPTSQEEERTQEVVPEAIPSSKEEEITELVKQETIPSSQEDVASEVINQEPRSSRQCDYSTGKWVPSTLAPLYNSSSCRTIKNGQNCAAHGRPDTGFLHWRWQPNACNLSQFSALEFLTLIQNKHLAFVGDSMARNQAESLLCLLSTAATPNLDYTSGEDNKFRRFSFPTFNATVSLFWSPFLVSGVEKSLAAPYNKLYLDTPEPTWAGELDKLDMVVFSAGHWFLHPALFYDAGVFIGCHQCPDVKPEPNYKETGFFHVFRKAVRTAIGAAGLKVKRVVVTTFSPAHFEGEWDSAGACRRIEPYQGDRQLEYMDGEMRKVEVEEVAKLAENSGQGLQIAAVDITKMASLRPDGHPGPYMNPNPFAEGVKERVQNDCVHWCLPGPIDAWNEVLLAVMKRWEEEM